MSTCFSPRFFTFSINLSGRELFEQKLLSWSRRKVTGIGWNSTEQREHKKYNVLSHKIDILLKRCAVKGGEVARRKLWKTEENFILLLFPLFSAFTQFMVINLCLKSLKLYTLWTRKVLRPRSWWCWRCWRCNDVRKTSPWTWTSLFWSFALENKTFSCWIDFFVTKQYTEIPFIDI